MKSIYEEKYKNDDKNYKWNKNSKIGLNIEKCDEEKKLEKKWKRIKYENKKLWTGDEKWNKINH